MFAELYKKHQNVLILISVLLIGLAIPHSDKTLVAIGFVSFLAIANAALWLFPSTQLPNVSFRYTFKVSILIIIALYLYLLILPVYSIFNNCVGDNGCLFDNSYFIIEIIKLGAIICAFLLGFRTSLNNESARNAFDTFAIIITIWAFISIIMFINDPGGVYGEAKMGAGRLTGAFSSPNTAGTIFGGVTALCLVRIARRWTETKGTVLSNRVSILHLSMFFICLTALLLSASRSAYLSTIIASIVMILIYAWGNNNFKMVFTLLVITFLLIIPIWFGWTDKLFQRFDTFDNDYMTRKVIFETYIDMFKQNWINGVGLGAFIPVNRTLLSVENYQELANINALHNVYLTWLFETGIIGFILSVAINSIIIGFCLINYFNGRNKDIRILAGLAMYLVFLIHGFTDYAAQEIVIAASEAIMLGIIFALAGNDRRKHRTNNKSKGTAPALIL